VTLLVAVVGRRNGGGYKAAEIVVVKADPHTRDADALAAAEKWAQLYGLELRLWEVVP